MKSFIKVTVFSCAAFLLVNCIRNQTYLVKPTYTAHPGDTIPFKILHRAIVFGLVDAQTKKLQSELKVTNLDLWVGNINGNKVVPNSARIHGYRLNQFDNAVLTWNDLDSNTKINRGAPRLDTMTVLRANPPDTLIVRALNDSRDTLYNKGKDSNIVWQGFTKQIYQTWFLLGKTHVDTLVFPAGTTPDTVVGGFGGFAIGVEVDFKVVVGSYKPGTTRFANYYYARAHTQIGGADDAALDFSVNVSFGAWENLVITQPVAIEKRDAPAKSFISFGGDNIQFQWNGASRSPVQIFNSQGNLIRNGLSNEGHYALSKNEIGPGTYFIRLQSENKQIAQKFTVK